MANSLTWSCGACNTQIPCNRNLCDGCVMGGRDVLSDAEVLEPTMNNVPSDEVDAA